MLLQLIQLKKKGFWWFLEWFGLFGKTIVNSHLHCVVKRIVYVYFVQNAFVFFRGIVESDQIGILLFYRHQLLFSIQFKSNDIGCEVEKMIRLFLPIWIFTKGNTGNAVTPANQIDISLLKKLNKLWNSS